MPRGEHPNSPVDIYIPCPGTQGSEREARERSEASPDSWYVFDVADDGRMSNAAAKYAAGLPTTDRGPISVYCGDRGQAVKLFDALGPRARSVRWWPPFGYELEGWDALAGGLKYALRERGERIASNIAQGIVWAPHGILSLRALFVEDVLFSRPDSQHAAIMRRKLDALPDAARAGRETWLAQYLGANSLDDLAGQLLSEWRLANVSGNPWYLLNAAKKVGPALALASLVGAREAAAWIASEKREDALKAAVLGDGLRAGPPFGLVPAWLSFRAWREEKPGKDIWAVLDKDAPVRADGAGDVRWAISLAMTLWNDVGWDGWRGKLWGLVDRYRGLDISAEDAVMSGLPPARYLASRYDPACFAIYSDGLAPAAELPEELRTLVVPLAGVRCFLATAAKQAKLPKFARSSLPDIEELQSKLKGRDRLDGLVLLALEVAGYEAVEKYLALVFPDAKGTPAHKLTEWLIQDRDPSLTGTGGIARNGTITDVMYDLMGHSVDELARRFELPFESDRRRTMAAVLKRLGLYEQHPSVPECGLTMFMHERSRLEGTGEELDDAGSGNLIVDTASAIERMLYESVLVHSHCLRWVKNVIGAPEKDHTATQFATLWKEGCSESHRAETAHILGRDMPAPRDVPELLTAIRNIRKNYAHRPDPTRAKGNPGEDVAKLRPLAERLYQNRDFRLMIPRAIRVRSIVHTELCWHVRGVDAIGAPVDFVARPGHANLEPGKRYLMLAAGNPVPVNPYLVEHSDVYAERG